MADRDLQTINSSGELTEIKLGGTTAAKSVLIQEQLGNFTFNVDKMEISGETVVSLEDAVYHYFKGKTIGANTEDGYLRISNETQALLRLTYNDGDTSDIAALPGQATIGCTVSGSTTQLRCDSSLGVVLSGQTTEKIDASTNAVLTRAYLEAKGASGTFTSNDGKTVTVTNGLITSIV